MDEQIEVSFYTHRGEAFYHVGPFDDEEAALKYINRAHKDLGGIGNVTMTLLNSPDTDPEDIRSGESFFEDAALDQEYYLERTP